MLRARGGVCLNWWALLLSNAKKMFLMNSGLAALSQFLVYLAENHLQPVIPMLSRFSVQMINCTSSCIACNGQSGDLEQWKRSSKRRPYMEGWHNVELFKFPLSGHSEYYLCILASSQEEIECCRNVSSPDPAVSREFPCHRDAR